MPTLTINGMNVDVPQGTTILNAANGVGVEIPHYCYHPKLSIAGNCRMCLVEVEKFPKLQTACSTVVTDGMVVRTDTEKVRKKKVQDIGGQIVLDAERCILCSRCVRFLTEVTGTRELEFFNRGDHSEISIFPGKPLANDYTGNLADICPVGALTSKDFRFKCRVWFLKAFDSICTGCSKGCNVDAHCKGDILYRLKPRWNDAVNQAWMCDVGRLTYKAMNEARLLTPFVREEGARKVAAWGSLLPDVAFRLKAAADKGGTDRVAVIASPQSSNEELYLLRRLATEVLGTKNLAFTHRVAGDGFADDFLIQADKNPNSRGAQLLGIPGEAAFDALMSGIAGGGIDALLVFGNVLGALSEEETAALLAKVPFVAQVGTNEGPVSKAATAVLPSASVAERGGTFTNHAGRVQRFRPGFPARGKAKNPIEILVALGNRLGAGWTFAGEASVFNTVAGTEASFAGMSYDSIGMFGQEVECPKS